MENTAFLETLKTLTSQEDLISVGREVNELNAKFEDYIIEEERKLQINQLDAEEKGELIPEDPALHQLKEDFRKLLKVYREKRKVLTEAKNTEEAGNLSKKKGLINKLRETIQNEENIGAAFGSLKEIQETWKEIGDIPREQRDDIQSEYSRLIEDFFYNINIYKQLKDHDLKRNAQMKQDVIAKLKELENTSSIKEVEQQLKSLQNEWEDIGPVNNDEWELLKDEYWKAVHSCYSRINIHYEEQRTILVKNLELKKELLANLTTVIDTIPQEADVKLWDNTTTKILQFQEDWKKIGFGPRKENEEIWLAFRTQCDRFFSLKKGFFSEVQKEFDKIAEKKKAIIIKANELKDSTDWKNTANQLVNLQKEWKGLGNAGQRYEQRLWKQFRAVCDTFFESRKKHFEEADTEFENNLATKNELIEKINSYIIPEDRKQALSDLQGFAKDFNAIGKVPLKEKNNVFNAFKKALDKHYNSLQLEGEEKNKILFQARLDTIAGSSDSSRLFAKEKAELRKKIDSLQHEILQLENNLGFFAHSKGADALKKDVEKKIITAKEEIVSLRQKIKLIPNE